MNINNYYSTSDLALATTLSLFYSLDSVDKTNPTKVLFLFKRSDDLDRFVEAFWKQELKIEPQSYFGQLKMIKSRIYQD